MVRDDRALLFCPYMAGPAILDKTKAVPTVEKSHRCELKVKSPKDHFSKNSHLTKCGRFVIFTNYLPQLPLENMVPKLLIVERCNLQQSQYQKEKERKKIYSPTQHKNI